MKCVLIASGAIKPDGKVEIESALGFVLEYIPVEFLVRKLIISSFSFAIHDFSITFYDVDVNILCPIFYRKRHLKVP